ncbi:hypothetical protein KVT40_005597 [Elsinoe batatas]|uniref:Large ribosomal subunit protein bL21m n=1 Tax=Elsinoe batatas TaxID=2601811 RepID=A0A8K0L040_9PEZI|nr:hypothetical protein KVT40_005597 [Elsinoe batatas]
MLSRSLRRAVLDTRWSLPPPYLLPWTANLTTTSQPTTSSTVPPASIPTSEPSTASQSTTSSPPTPSSNPNLATSLQSSKAPRNPPSPHPLSPSIRTLLPLLLAQRQIYIKSHIHARPYLLTQGDTLRLPFLMPGVQPGDILRLDRASLIGSRDFTLRAPGLERRGKSATAGTSRVGERDMRAAVADKAWRERAMRGETAVEGTAEGVEMIRGPQGDGVEGESQVVAAGDQPPEPFVSHLAKGRVSYLDSRLFVCRAVVMGTESEPMRVMEKTKRRQRHTRHVKSKHRYTVLKIKELRVKSVEEIESGTQD